MKFLKQLALFTIAGLILSTSLTGCSLFERTETDGDTYDEHEDDEYYEASEEIAEDPCSDDTWQLLFQKRDTLTALYDDMIDAIDNETIEETEEISAELEAAADLINYFATYKQKDVSETMAASVEAEMDTLIISFESELN